MDDIDFKPHTPDELPEHGIPEFQPIDRPEPEPEQDLAPADYPPPM